MRKEFGSDETFYRSFTNEARAAAQLNHVNVAQLYSFGQEKGQPYIVMELVFGERLDGLMEQGTAVEEATVLRTAIDIAQGLDAAFQAGLIHGDIKPANILYDETGRAKIVDFGLAGHIDRKKKLKDVWGTPYYIAPEKARKKGEDQRSDQYSFGCTLWHALIGRPPFDGDTPTKVVLSRMDREPPGLQEADPSISPRTTELVERMMALKPPHRYPTYASLSFRTFGRPWILFPTGNGRGGRQRRKSRKRVKGARSRNPFRERPPPPTQPHQPRGEFPLSSG